MPLTSPRLDGGRVLASHLGRRRSDMIVTNTVHAEVIAR